MSRTHHQPRRLSLVLVFLLVALLSSIPRFGQRENEALPTISDSDLYLEMAHVFVGETPGFDPERLETWPHHYNRPLLPFLAGWLGRLVLSDDFRAAFSAINVLSAVVTALLLHGVVRRHWPYGRLNWLPSVLFLCGFPQMNWGYHILTDTLGVTTAFAASCYAAWLMRGLDEGPGWTKSRWGTHLLLLWIVSSLAFLARETGWIAVVCTSTLLLARRSHGGPVLLLGSLIVIAVALGKLPHALYAERFGTMGLPILPSIATAFDYRYMLDFSVKTAVSFNLAWVLAALALKGRPRLPEVVLGWTVGAVLYMGAAYMVNSFDLVGYPLRMSYSLFPLVLVLAARGLGSLAARGRLVVGYCLVQFSINLIGVFLDPGQGRIRVTDLLERLG